MSGEEKKPDNLGSGTGAKKSPATAPKKKSKKKLWVLGCVVAVIAAGAIGFNVWHNQPTFCNDICHQPMDNYVDGYYHDASLMSYEHQMAKTGCLDCHEASLDLQIKEALSWASHSFKTDDAGNLVDHGMQLGYSTCAKSGCHDYEKVIQATENWGGKEGVNPHYSHQFYSETTGNVSIHPAEDAYAMDCTYCHSAHGQSVFYCNTCHDYEVPNGWKNPALDDDSKKD